jgi:hypothetical protein
MNFKIIKQLPLLGILVFSLCSFVVSKNHNHENYKNDFAAFLSHFNKVDKPNALDLASLDLAFKNNTFTKEKILIDNVLIEKFIFGRPRFKISRMGPPEIYPVARYYPTEEHVAVVYVSKMRFGNAPLSYIVKMFDLNGQPIQVKNTKGVLNKFGSMPIASKGYHNATTFEMKDDGTYCLKDFEPEWKLDVGKFGVYDNEVISYHLKDTRFYKVNPKGQIQHLSIPAVKDRAMLSDFDLH